MRRDAAVAGMPSAVLLLAASSLHAVPAPSAALADDFRHGASRWQVEAEMPGASRVTVAHGVMDIEAAGGISVWWTHELHGPVAIEYEVMAVSGKGANDTVSDANAFWMASDPAVPGGSVLAHPRDGAFARYDALRTYYVGIGGNRNTTTRMRRYVGEPGNRPLRPEHDRADPATLLTPGRWTAVRLTAAGSTIAVDYAGKRLFTMTDTQPYRRGWFALRTTKSHLRIRNFRIEPLGKDHR